MKRKSLLRREIAHTARTGLGGIFLRVTTAGTIAEGDTLRLVNRPHPAWTLARVAHLLYSEAVDAKYKIARWPGTRAELYELQALPQLALLEYRDECDKLIARDKAGTLELAGEGWRLGSSVGCGVVMLLAVAGAALARRGLG